jgi:hypothetical protein
MIASRRFLWFAALAGLALLGLQLRTANSEEKPGGQPPPKPRLDRGKTAVIERPVVDVVKKTAPPAAPAPAAQPVVAPPMPRLDVGKSGVIEPQMQRLVQIRAAAAAVAAAKTDFVNPKVEPGKVKWHKDLETAKAAALKSKKPVLLFQMMGKLDDQFC